MAGFASGGPGRQDCGVDDEVTEQLVARVAQRYVMPGHRFMYLVAGNMLGLGGQTRVQFGVRLAKDARDVTDNELRVLFTGGWRERLTAAWLAGMDRRVQLRGLIMDLLLEDELVSAGQGYCFALARFGTAQDADVLVAYLDRYLPVFGGHRAWALGALLYLDTQHGTNHAAPFLTPDGPWDQWVAMGRSATYTNPESEHRKLTELCAFVEAYELPQVRSAEG
jgi:hypothetical protein